MFDLEDDQERPAHWLLGESARVALINLPLALNVISAEYTSWLFQERPRQPDLSSGFVQVMHSRGGKVFATPSEAWASQWLSNLGWIVLAICVALFWLRTRLAPGSPLIRIPKEGVPYPAEFVATLIVLASIAWGVVTQKF